LYRGAQRRGYEYSTIVICDIDHGRFRRSEAAHSIVEEQTDAYDAQDNIHYQGHGPFHNATQRVLDDALHIAATEE